MTAIISTMIPQMMNTLIVAVPGLSVVGVLLIVGTMGPPMVDEAWLVSVVDKGWSVSLVDEGRSVGVVDEG